MVIPEEKSPKIRQIAVQHGPASLRTIYDPQRFSMGSVAPHAAYTAGVRVESDCRKK